MFIIQTIFRIRNEQDEARENKNDELDLVGQRDVFIETVTKYCDVYKPKKTNLVHQALVQTPAQPLLRKI